MEVLQGYRFRARPSRAQAVFFARTAGTCRVLYNLALEQRQAAWKSRKVSVRYGWQSAELPALKEAFPWFGEAPHHALQRTLKDLDAAFSRFFAGTAGYPKFKRKGQDESFTFPDRNQIELTQAVGKGRRGLLKLPKTGLLSFVQHRKVEGEVRSVTISQEADGWYVSILTKRTVEEPKPVTGPAVGVDLGVSKPIVLSTGKHFAVPGLSCGEAGRLRRLQNKLSRQVKGSGSRAITKQKISELHQRERRRRNHALHRISNHLSSTHSLTVVEGLKVQSMTRSAKGTLENPGKNVAQKSGLNRAILKQGWGEFRRQLGYKTKWRGTGMVAIADYAYTSQECSACGHVSSENRVSQAHFECQACGIVLNADVNAAKNVLARGLRVTAGGALDAGRALKPEVQSEPQGSS